jgi:iodotyrosine deiodinase
MQSVKMINGYTFISYSKITYETTEMTEGSFSFYKHMDTRLTYSDLSDKPASKEVIESILLTASTAPSGAHKQLWTFSVVSNAEPKKIRTAA